MKRFLLLSFAIVTTLALASCVSSGSALYEAAWSGKSDVVRELLYKGENVNERGSYGNFTPLWGASRYGFNDVVRMLLDKGASVNDDKNLSHTSALAIAVTFQHPDVVRTLLDHGANPDSEATKDHDGLTVLMMAVDYLNVEIVDALIKKGAKVNLLSHPAFQKEATIVFHEGNIVTCNGYTALTYANRKEVDGINLHKKYEIIDLLKNAGAKEAPFIVQGPWLVGPSEILARALECYYQYKAL
ncbi:MAG: ankyrin repeat domain-containing protein [Methylococcales bacterium]